MARLMRRRLSEDDRGVSDILSIAFMFLIVVFAGVLLHSYMSNIISSSSDRQLQLKTEYLYRTLELSQVENYSISYLEALAENVAGITPQVILGDYLYARVDNVLSYLRSSGYAVMVEVIYDENSYWRQVYPSDARVLVENAEKFANVEKFTFSGKVTIIIAETEGKIARENATLIMFKWR